MPKINMLDAEVAQLIAAGEVVERPGSVVKELVENCIDAGATTVTVELKNGGNTYIRISDNGCGISRADCPAAFMPHATCKISRAADLDCIGTLGFRGEALASVAAVARIELVTKTAEEEVGTRFALEGGEILTIEDTGCPVGTVITVRDLFFNTPARLKFLKKDLAEANYIAQIMDRLALSHPEISFRLIKENGEHLHTPGDGKLISAVYSVMGADFARNLTEVRCDCGAYSVDGFVCPPTETRKNRNMQIFFLNGRYIKSNTFAAALERAYKDCLMQGSFPACVLNVSVPPNTVDVNVHPAKTEVRFADEREAFSAVYYAVKTALDRGSDVRREISSQSFGGIKTAQAFSVAESPAAPKTAGWHDSAAAPAAPKTAGWHDSADAPAAPKTAGWHDASAIPTAPKTAGWHDSAAPMALRRPLPDISTDDTEESPAATAPIASAAATAATPAADTAADISSTSAASATAVTPPSAAMPAVAVARDSSDEASAPAPLPFAQSEAVVVTSKGEYRYIGEAFDTYMIVTQGDKLYFVDKHALHEREIYNILRENAESYSQLLLTPISVTLTKEEYSVITENADIIRKTGLDISDFGDGTVLVRAMPMHLTASDARDTVCELAGRLMENPMAVDTEKSDWIYHSVACRAAIKAGHKSSPEELIALLKKMDDIRFCPHGRPVTVCLPKSKLEKEFGRA